MRRASCQLATLLAAATLLSYCQPAPAATPTPSPTAVTPPSPEPARERWGLIVLYQKGDACTHLAGPPRIGAYRGEPVIWRVYNECRKEATVEITDLRLSPGDREGFTYADSWEAIAKVKRERQGYEKLDPFATEGKKLKVKGGAIADLRLMVAARAKVGLYSYVVAVDGKPDEGDIDIWPPRP